MAGGRNVITSLPASNSSRHQWLPCFFSSDRLDRLLQSAQALQHLRWKCSRVFLLSHREASLEVENNGLGIYLPSTRHVVASRRAGVRRPGEPERLQPLPKFLKAARTLVGIAILARRHFVRPSPPSVRSRTDVVSREHKLLFELSVSFPWTVQLRSAVPAAAASLHPNVLPFDLPRVQGTSDPAAIRGGSSA